MTRVTWEHHLACGRCEDCYNADEMPVPPPSMRPLAERVLKLEEITEELTRRFGGFVPVRRCEHVFADVPTRLRRCTRPGCNAILVSHRGPMTEGAIKPGSAIYREPVGPRHPDCEAGLHMYAPEANGVRWCDRQCGAGVLTEPIEYVSCRIELEETP